MDVWAPSRHCTVEYPVRCAMFLVCLWLCDDVGDADDCIDPAIVESLFMMGGVIRCGDMSSPMEYGPNGSRRACMTSFFQG